MLQSIGVAYGRNLNSPGVQLAPPTAPGTPPDLTIDASAFAQSEQATALITLSENMFTGAIDEPDAYRTPVPAETFSYELTRPLRPDDSVAYLFADLQNLADAAEQIPYETVPDLTLIQKRLVEDVRILYLKDDLSGPLPPGQSGSLGLVCETYKLAFTSNLAEQVFIANNSNPNKPADVASLSTILGGEAGYVNSEGDVNWWIPSGQVIYSPVPVNPPNPFVQDATFAAANFYLAQAHRDPFGQYTRLTSDSYKLLLAQTQDALGNTIIARNDYRVLQPAEVIDPNQNHIEVALDVLGMVVGTAVKGKVSTLGTSESGDSFVQFTVDLQQSDIDGFINIANPLTPAPGLLGTATTRIIYDLERFSETQAANPADPTQWKPIFSATIVRETHVGDVSAGQQAEVQVSFSYSDGLGREIQKKVQAEAGPLDLTDPKAPVVDPRWVGSGWTILDNKAKPVRQYEPFFTATHDFEFANKVGVTPTLFYDPLERVVVTLHPNHTWEKVVFDAWLQKTWDVNDTVTLDPKSDRDVGDLFSLLPDSDYLPTWYQLRTDPALSAIAFTDPDLRSAELDAANEAPVHNDTPTVVLFDVLGRPFLSVTHNRFQKDGANVDGFYSTRTELDIESNQLSVTDALGRTVIRYDYDLLNSRIHQASIEAGERWILNDVTGKPLYGWDSRSHRFRTAYDLIRRPTDSFLVDASSEILMAHNVYGESRSNPEANNLRGKLVELHDQAGVLTSEEYDFKGNLLTSSRQFLQNYQDETDLSQSPVLEDGTFTNRTSYDALNRPTSVSAPDNSIHRPTFNEANLLERLDVQFRGANNWTPLVTNIDYNAKGQRKLIEYGDGASTSYDYDPQTFRLTQLRTTRPQGLNGVSSQLFQDPGVVQDLNYTYDPSGNVTRARDNSLPVLYYNNEQIAPTSDYSYDAIYRLVAATGREHIGQTTFAPEPQTGNLRDYPFLGLAANPNDLQAMRNYTELYAYDAVGNFNTLTHIAQNGNWSRTYNYNEASLLEPGKLSNRLSSTQIGASPAESYLYDAHGNIIRMPQLPTMDWDFKDQLHATQQQVVDNSAGEKTYYVYDGSGQRLRKITELQNGTKKKERMYFAGFEVYREYDANGATSLERETLHVLDDKRPIARVETRTQGNDASPYQVTRYQFSNHLESASLELDDSGQMISYEEYYPYGSTSFQAGRSAVEVGLKRYRYTGMERDEESGLNYHGARYCALWLGRWMSPDPAGIDDQISMYVFSRNNPMTFIDQNGRNSEEVSKAEAALIEARGNLSKLVDQLEKTVGTKAELEAVLDQAGKSISELQSDIKNLNPNASNFATRKAELEHELLMNQVSYGLAKSDLEATQGRLKQVKSEIKKSQGAVKTLVRRVTKLGGDPTLEPGDTKYGIGDEESLAETESDELEKKFEELERKSSLPGGGGASGTRSKPSKRWKGGASGGASVGASIATMTEIALTLTAQMFAELAPKKTWTETEIDNFKGWGSDILRGLATSGPAGAVKAIMGDPTRLAVAAATVQVSPHMFGARGGIQALAGECMNPANCMKMDYRYYVINSINSVRRMQGKPDITWGQLASGNYQ